MSHEQDPRDGNESGPELVGLDLLLKTFSSAAVSVKQVAEVYRLSGENCGIATSCLLSGPSLSSLLKMLNNRYESLPRNRVIVDDGDAWGEMVSRYKRPSFDYHTHLRVTLGGQPAVDTGGVRRHLYTILFDAFSNNKFVRLFDGPAHHLRPVCSAEARSTGLLKVLGGMVGHSICQDGVGFPHLSPTCFWYVVGGEEKALQYACTEDLPADAVFVLSQVCGVLPCVHACMQVLVFVCVCVCVCVRCNPYLLLIAVATKRKG